MIFAEEKVKDCIGELYPMWQKHWEETEMYRKGRVLNPDIKRYVDFSNSGYYRLYTVRLDGVLVGNCGMYSTISMHEQKQSAIEDTWYMTPEHRGGWTMLKFLKYVEGELKALGIEDIYMSTKLTNRAGDILKLRGYTYMANQFWKELT